MAPGKTTRVAGEAKLNKESDKGEDATVERPEGRPCTAELKELLRLLGVKFTYDPDKKDGTLDFSPFR